jgi:hypothetical protein
MKEVLAFFQLFLMPTPSFWRTSMAMETKLSEPVSNSHQTLPIPAQPEILNTSPLNHLAIWQANYKAIFDEFEGTVQNLTLTYSLPRNK